MRETAPVLTLAGVSKSFGALSVLTDIGLDVFPGETLGLIGPNGAGKTTLFNVITGFLRPDRGEVRFHGEDLRRQRPEKRVQAGLVRTFQKSMVFPTLNARENLALAIRARDKAGMGWWNTARSLREADAEAENLLARAGLRRLADAPVGSQSYGEQRMIDILISVALRPALLLLDEPTAGLAYEEGERLLKLVRLHDTGTSVILIAHDLDVVFGTCDRVAVLNLGCLVAVDTPAAIRRHDGVRAAYLGTLAEAGACH
jgi:branched-chain amino acid transport system ATP-binding protein